MKYTNQSRRRATFTVWTLGIEILKQFQPCRYIYRDRDGVPKYSKEERITVERYPGVKKK